MILSKLILFFCFYLLLLDNSLGQRLLVELDGNQKLFKNAIEYGKTYGGLLGLLGSQWKQLLIQLVHAKRNVGLGKVQLARFNDSATTEEVGLAITDNYADKVAELVAIRTQDIGATQKYIDDLEILKNEIALTMIVEMDEIKEQFKQKNVRRKIKEAKENGLTDTDIKEILFAEFFDSEAGLSLIGSRASTADALLSSFLNGMKRILHGTYGIIQYGNGGGDGGSVDGGAGGGDDVPVEDGSDAGEDSDADNNDVDQGNTQGGGGSAPGGGGAPGGGPPDGPPNGPPDGPPDGPPNGPPDDNEDDDEDGGDSEGAGGPAAGRDGPPISQPKDDDRIDDEVINLFSQIADADEITEESLDEMLFPIRFNEGGAYTDSPQFSMQVEELAQTLLEPIDQFYRDLINPIADQVTALELERSSGYQSDPSFQESLDPNLNDADRLALSFCRADYIESLLDMMNPLYENYRDLRDQVSHQFNLAAQNMIFYGKRVSGEVSGNTSPVPMPPPLPEFNLSKPEDNAWRYLLSRNHMESFTAFRLRVRLDFDRYSKVKRNITNDLNAERARIEGLEDPPPS